VQSTFGITIRVRLCTSGTEGAFASTRFRIGVGRTCYADTVASRILVGTTNCTSRGTCCLITTATSLATGQSINSGNSTSRTSATRSSIGREFTRVTLITSITSTVHLGTRCAASATTRTGRSILGGRTISTRRVGSRKLTITALNACIGRIIWS